MKKCIYHQSLACGMLMLSFLAANGQSKNEVITTTQKIADKVIRETGFEFQMVPLAYNGGIIWFSLENANGGNPGQVSYAVATMNSLADTVGSLGLSYLGSITLFLNGEEIYRGSSGMMDLQEYTYNRYRFDHRIEVRWKKGENKILVQCSGKGVEVIMLPVDPIDQKEAFVSALPASIETPLSYWTTCGPLSQELMLPQPGGELPSGDFTESFGLKKHLVRWEIQPVPMLKELVIPEGASYTRDPYSDWHYANGGTMLGILSLYDLTGQDSYLEFVKQFASTLLENNDYFRWQYQVLHAMRGSYHRIHRMTMLDDSGGPAIPFAQLQLLEPETDLYKAILDHVYDYVMFGQERLPDGTFCRPEPEPATIWADDLFMSAPILLRMAEINGDASLYDEVAQQVIHFNNYLMDPETGLYFHGWYNHRQKNTPVLWSRANGWVVWATTEVLLHLPEDHPKYRTILRIFQEHMKALAAVQDASGMWHQVLDHPETFLETSSTAMFTLGMARGTRMGWLGKEYGERALKGWNALQEKIGPDGNVKDICRGTEIGDDVEFYQNRKRFDHDPRGLGAMITAGCEISLLLEK